MTAPSRVEVLESLLDRKGDCYDLTLDEHNALRAAIALMRAPVGDAIGSVDGTVVYRRSEGAGKACVCCDGDHVYSRTIVYDNKATRPDDTALDELIRRFIGQVENEGARVRITLAAMQQTTGGGE